MKDAAKIYRVEILRAVLGPAAHTGKVHDMARLNQIAEHLANCEDAQSILRAKGHGSAGMTFVEVARDVPPNVRQVIKRLFRTPQPESLRVLAEARGSRGSH